MSPSKIPFLARPLPRSSVNWAASAPASSSAFTWLKKSFLIRRVGASFFNANMVPPSSVSNTRCLNVGWAEDSAATAKRVPICTPSAPRVMAATWGYSSCGNNREGTGFHYIGNQGERGCFFPSVMSPGFKTFCDNRIYSCLFAFLCEQGTTDHVYHSDTMRL